MGKSSNLRDLSTHFQFGANWASYARLIGEPEIRGAVEGLNRLLDADWIRGKTFLDIGCGSGLHSLAAVKLGAARVLATDIDPNSVATTESVLKLHASESNWAAQKVSVFELDPKTVGTFDVVYSWGVLHHTGAMYDAIAQAASLVAPGGLLCIALYGKTKFCGSWRVEKKFYSSAPQWIQSALTALYIGAMRTGFVVTGRNFRVHLDNYNTRGMDFRHDVHDWLGGYPYESISPAEAHAAMEKLGLVPVREFTHERLGLFGTGCDEYVYQRRA